MTPHTEYRFCSSSCPSLKSVSRGSEEERQIGIVHSSNTKWDIPTLSDADEKKARVLLSHLRDSGQTVSVDEVRGMIASQSLSGMRNGAAYVAGTDEPPICTRPICTKPMC